MSVDAHGMLLGANRRFPRFSFFNKGWDRGLVSLSVSEYPWAWRSASADAHVRSLSSRKQMAFLKERKQKEEKRIH